MTGKKVPKERRTAPAITPEDREDQLIALATNLAEKKLRDGTASNQIIAHYLRAGSMRESLEKEKLRRENEMLKAKTKALESEKRVEDLYANAINAFKLYRGDTEKEDESDYEEY